jgi:hypothetical protein
LAGVPRVELVAVGRLEAGAVHAVALVGAEVGRRRLGRDRHEGFDRLVATHLVGPDVEERASLREGVGRLLVLLVLLHLDGVAGPVDPRPHAVVVERLLVAGQGAGTDALAAQLAEDRDVDLFAALLERVDDADDRGHLRALVRARTGSRATIRR